MGDESQTAKPERWPSTRRIGTRLTGRFDRDAWEAVERILEYFDTYKLGSAAPIATEIEILLELAYADGATDAG